MKWPQRPFNNSQSGQSVATFSGIYDSMVRSYIQELFEKYARLDHNVDAKGIQSMCYNHGIFVPIETVLNSMREVFVYGFDDPLVLEESSVLLDYELFQIWYRSHPTLTVNMKKENDPEAEYDGDVLRLRPFFIRMMLRSPVVLASLHYRNFKRFMRL